MRSIFGRLFTTTVIVVLIAIVGLGFSFRFSVENFLTEEREEALSTKAHTISELAVQYFVANHLQPREDLSMALRSNLSLAEDMSGANILLTDPQGRITFCSCHMPTCIHLNQVLDARLVQQAVRAPQIQTGYLHGIYPEKRYIATEPCVYNGHLVGIVLISEPIESMVKILSQMTQMFIFIALIVLVLTFVSISIFTQGQCRPLKDMANAAREFGHGNLKVRVDTGGDNTLEVDELAVAFNNMACSLEKSEYQRQEFVANVSHELKTPMTTISGYVDGILDGTIPPQAQKKYLSLVSGEVKRLNRLVRSMLNVSRLQDQGIPADKMTPFDVAECMGQVLITFEQKINDKNLDVQVNFPEYPIYARADLDSITQVVYNLIDNAVKFCPQQGILGLTLRQAGSKVFVSVSNTGETIPPEELPLVFDRFHKIDKSRSLNRDSWGLGLYIVKTIVCSHGEDISVTSRDGKTEFTFTLTKVNSL